MEILGERPVWSMSSGEMVSTLDATHAEIARLETLALHLTAGLEAIGYAQEVGAGTTARFLTFRYRIDATKARRDVHLANALPKYPAVAAALPDAAPESSVGDSVEGAGGGVLLHPAQAEAIVSALDKLPTTVPVEDLQVAEREMVELGRTHGPLDLRKAGVQIRNRLDTDGPEPAEQKAYDRETLQLKTAENGVAFSGFLANENAELFRTLIHTHAKPHKTIDGALDPRTRDKRRADALITVLTSATGGCTMRTAAAAAATADGAKPDGGASEFRAGHGAKPHIIVTIDFKDLQAATASATGQLIYGDGLSAATIRRLACDAHVLPIVLGSDSQPLDVGTTVRLATGPLRKALIARDKGCVCCGAPPIYCDAHHVISWIDRGETKIDNLVLLCKRCHRDLHAGHWDIHIADGIVHVARPAWATPDPVPSRRYGPPTIRPHPAPNASGTTSSSATSSGAPARVWPRETDPPWITAEDAARLDPWGEAGDDGLRRISHEAAGRAAMTGLDIWGEALHDQPVQPRNRQATDIDPWGDRAPGDQDVGTGSDDGARAESTMDPWSGSAEPQGGMAAA
ncbi:HNH endonuclease [Kribbella sp. NBC_00709]|uniref:HNH endonuclease signature motif containing protein n=1 Tax=Kribbella sp. NBC_00709 TaxID=2975972 RepID=UPI002E2D5321|nr:DUF222 domain-containing protein [Kribbella sp. NBC_00709]